MHTLPSHEYADRRQRLMADLSEDAVVIVPAGQLKIRNRDAEYPFRQHSDFLYLTGFPEPDAILVLRPGEGQNGEAVLFCLPRDPAKELWTGYRAGPEGGVERFGMDRAFNLDELDTRMPELLAGRGTILCPLDDTDLQARISGWRGQVARGGKGQVAPARLEELGELLHEMRLIKSPAEQELMRLCGRISADGHRRAMIYCRPERYEFQLEAEIHHEFAHHGSRVPAYGTIVGSGANGCILHYTENADRLRDDDLVLIDAGCELDGYAGDITRTFPVNGRFSDQQRALYEVVLAAQEAAIAAVAPGNSFNLPHEKAVEVLTDGLLRLGLLEGERQALIDQEAYKVFYPHRTSHWLGLDVHDVGRYRQNGEWRELQPGMVLTVEPGLYVAPDNDSVAAAWRGIGIRIEDDVLVTARGHEVLTDAVPKAIDEIEKLMQESAP